MHILFLTSVVLVVIDGDPTLVTIAGQSSGGTSVFALLSSPSAAGLFSRVRTFPQDI